MLLREPYLANTTAFCKEAKCGNIKKSSNQQTPLQTYLRPTVTMRMAHLLSLRESL